MSHYGWEVYKRAYWKALNIGVRLFGGLAVVVGMVFGLWGGSLLLNPELTITVNGVPTAEIGPKFVIVLTGLTCLILGIGCLFARAYSPGETPMFSQWTNIILGRQVVKRQD